MQIPLVDLKQQYAGIKDEVQEAMQQVLDKCDFILGENVSAFESEFAKATGSKHSIACASGTDALILALKALNIGSGDEVITVSYTWAATAFAISEVGAKPVFIDILPDTYVMNPALIEAAITPKTKAILPVHLYGQPAPMDDIAAIAQKHNLEIIEDTCQSHLAEWNGKTMGSWGKVAAYSFYPGKNLGAYGDGGGMTTNDDKLNDHLRMMRHVGQASRNIHDAIGMNSRLDTLQAAVLRVKLKYLPQWTTQRQKAAENYNHLLADLNCITPKVDANAKHVYHVYAIQVENRDEVIKQLNTKGVMAQIHYPNSLHLQPCYKDLGYSPGSLLITEQTCERILSLPIFPEITPEQQQYVTTTLKDTLCPILT